VHQLAPPQPIVALIHVRCGTHMSTSREEFDNCGGEIPREQRASVVARNTDEPGILHERRELISVGPSVPITDSDKRRDSNLSQCILRGRNKRVPPSRDTCNRRNMRLRR